MTDKVLPPADKEEATLEAQLQALGLNAPRVTPAMIDAMIEQVVYYELTETHTVCKLVMLGGRFHVTGESSTVSKENFDPKIAEEVSYRNARNKVWPVAGAILANDLHNFRMPLDEEHLKLDVGVQRVILETKEVAQRVDGLKAVLSIPNIAEQLPEGELQDIAAACDLYVQLKAVLERRLQRAGV